MMGISTPIFACMENRLQIIRIKLWMYWTNFKPFLTYLCVHHVMDNIPEKRWRQHRLRWGQVERGQRYRDGLWSLEGAENDGWGSWNCIVDALKLNYSTEFQKSVCQVSTLVVSLTILPCLVGVWSTSIFSFFVSSRTSSIGLILSLSFCFCW